MPLNRDSMRELRLAFTLSGVIALRMLGLFLILPVFMILAADVPGFSPALGGLALGAYGLTQALLQQPFGWLSDRLGRRPVLLSGLALFAVGGVVAATADTIGGLIAGRALQGCGAIAGVALAFASDFTRPEKRPVVMAVIGMGIGAAFLVSLVSSVPLAHALGLSGMFWLTVAFAILGMVLVLSTPRTAMIGAVTTAPPRESVAPIRFLAFSVFMLHAVMTSLFVVLPGRLVAEQGLELAQHWRVYVPAMLASVLIALPLLAWVGRRGRERTVLPWSFALLGGALLLLSGQPAPVALAVWLALYFTGFNVLEAAMPALVARLAGDAGRGRRMGLYSTFQFLGAFAGGAGGGMLLGSWGGQMTLFAAAALCLVWSLLIGRVSSSSFPTGQAK